MNVKKNILVGIFLTSSSSIAVQTIHLITKVIIARILFPSDFGIISLAFSILSFFEIIQRLGLDDAVIKEKIKINKTIYSANTFILIITLLLCICIVVVSGKIGAFYESPALSNVLLLLAVGFAVNSFGIIPFTVLEKKMAYKKQIIIEVSEAVTYSALTIMLAIAGFAFWSLIFAYVVSYLVRTIFTLILSPLKMKLMLDIPAIKRSLTFGTKILEATILIYLFTNILSLYIGKMLNLEELGFYSMGILGPMILSQNFKTVSRKVLYPMYAKFNLKLNYSYALFIKIFKYSLLVLVPLLGIMFALSSNIIYYILGAKWLGVIPIFQIMIVYLVFDIIQNNTIYLFHANNKPSTYRNLEVVNLLILIICAPVLILKYGIIGAALSLTITTAIFSMMALYFASTLFRTSIIQVLKYTIMPFALSILIVIIITVLKSAFLSKITILNSIVLFMISMILYGALLFIFSYGEFNILKKEIQKLCPKF
jgi:teichuronic acid exporter